MIVLDGFMRNNVIISFDYELFFGDEPGTVQKSLLEPTSKLMDALEYAGAKGNFFVDYLMLKYMLQENDTTKKEAALIIEQLKDMVRRGHRMELHMHPHWVDAKYVDNKWDFSDFSHYCLNSFSKDEITRMFVEGTEFLERIAREVDPSYKIIAYRAGGWAILPFEMMKEGFEKTGIKVDSSVMKDRVIHAYGYDLDFTNTPEKAVYNFNNDVLKEERNGAFIEAQIGSFRHTIVTTLLNNWYYSRHLDEFHRLTDGSHTRKNDRREPAEPMSRWQSYHKEQTFGLAGLPSFLLNYEIRKSKASYVVLISHPKDFMPITCPNIKAMKDKFIFCTYEDLL